MALSIEDLKPKKSNLPPRIIFYAVGGFGKTTFASQSPKPIFIQAEDGAGMLELAGKKVTNYDEVIEVISFLAEEKHDFLTVVIDTMDAMEKIIYNEVIKRHDKPIQSIEDIGFGKGYVKANELWNNLLSSLDYLREHKKLMVVILGHTKIKGYTPPDSEPYDRYTFGLQDSKNTSTAELLRGWADIILFGNYKVITKKVEGKTQATSKSNERAIYTEERPTHWGKNRYNMPYELPFPLESWKEVEKVIFKK
jgi:hypothetical protein